MERYPIQLSGSSLEQCRGSDLKSLRVGEIIKFVAQMTKTAGNKDLVDMIDLVDYYLKLKYSDSFY